MAQTSNVANPASIVICLPERGRDSRRALASSAAPCFLSGSYIEQIRTVHQCGEVVKWQTHFHWFWRSRCRGVASNSTMICLESCEFPLKDMSRRNQRKCRTHIQLRIRLSQGKILGEESIEGTAGNDIRRSARFFSSPKYYRTIIYIGFGGMMFLCVLAGTLIWAVLRPQEALLRSAPDLLCIRASYFLSHDFSVRGHNPPTLSVTSNSSLEPLSTQLRFAINSLVQFPVHPVDRP